MKFSVRDSMKRTKNHIVSIFTIVSLMIISTNTLRAEADILSGQCYLPNVSGVIIEIKDGGEVIDSFTTGPGGYFSYRMNGNLSPGTYDFYAHDSNGSYWGTLVYVSGEDIDDYDFALGVQ